MKQCEKCLVFFTPPWIAHRNSYAFSHCKKCCDAYYKVLMWPALLDTLKNERDRRQAIDRE